MDLNSMMPVVPTTGGGMFGGSGGSSDWIVFLIIAIIFGWGNGGIGGRNGNFAGGELLAVTKSL